MNWIKLYKFSFTGYLTGCMLSYIMHQVSRNKYEIHYKEHYPKYTFNNFFNNNIGYMGLMIGTYLAVKN